MKVKVYVNERDWKAARAAAKAAALTNGEDREDFSQEEVSSFLQSDNKVVGISPTTFPCDRGLVFQADSKGRIFVDCGEDAPAIFPHLSEEEVDEKDTDDVIEITETLYVHEVNSWAREHGIDVEFLPAVDLYLMGYKYRGPHSLPRLLKMWGDTFDDIDKAQAGLSSSQKELEELKAKEKSITIAISELRSVGAPE